MIETILVSRDGKGYIDVNQPDASLPYSIEERECATQERLIFWVSHLVEKRWFTKEHVRQFIIIAKQVIKDLA